MYTIRFIPGKGIVLECHDCDLRFYVEDFQGTPADARSLATTAMWKHMRDMHKDATMGKKPRLGTPKPD